MGEIASQVTVQGSRKDPSFPKERERRISYTYTRRTGHCPDPEHKRRSSTTFIGINKNGWVFECRHTDATHLFVNQPPKGKLPAEETKLSAWKESTEGDDT